MIFLQRYAHTAWGLALLVAMTACFWLYIDRLQTERELSSAVAELAEERAARDRERADLTAAALRESERARAIETEWRTRHDAAAAAAQQQLDRARADARLARAAGDSLRNRAEVYARQCAGQGAAAGVRPGAAGPGAATGGPGAVLADVLGRLEAAGRELAAVADARGAAGTACERAHDALSGAGPPD